ncbi:MAG TPA: peptidoglycan-binding domain-containing protein [Terracidiphilus sp.]|nr:peptidoglycan-binding domain-containing protein [Terracidiphilus sp.]
MTNFKSFLCFTFVGVLCITPAFATAHHAASSHHAAVHKSSTKSRKASHRVHGQQSIAPERVTQIQQALIREHYLTGAPSGEWDSTTQAAMQKFQADHGWQTRLMPDSRALVKLGLGPDYSGAINASETSFAAPPPVSTIPAQQTSGFAAASGVNR